MSGNAVISLVPFASRAQGYPGCQGLELNQNPAAVDKLADCLRLAAREYRRGPDAPIVRDVGKDTNYVAAMKRAAKDLPADSARPAVVMFTDGKHDVDGIPVSRVASERSACSATGAVRLPPGRHGSGTQESNGTGGRTPGPHDDRRQDGILRRGRPQSNGRTSSSTRRRKQGGLSPSRSRRSLAHSPPSPIQPAPTPLPEPPGLVRSVELAADDGFIDGQLARAGGRRLEPDRGLPGPVPDRRPGTGWFFRRTIAATTTDVGHLDQWQPATRARLPQSVLPEGAMGASPAGATTDGHPSSARQAGRRRQGQVRSRQRRDGARRW